MKTSGMRVLAVVLSATVGAALSAWASEPRMDQASAKRARLIQRVLGQRLGLVSRAYVDGRSVGVSYETQIREEDELSAEIAAAALIAWVGAGKPAEVHVYVLADGVPVLYAFIPGAAVGEFGSGKVKFDEFIKQWQICSLVPGAPRPREFFIQPWMMPDAWSETRTRGAPADEALAAVGLSPPDDPPLDEWPAAIQDLLTDQGKVTLAVLMAPTVSDARRAWEAIVGAPADGRHRAAPLPGHSGAFARLRANILYVAAGPGFVGRKAVNVASAMAVGHQGKACFVDAAKASAATAGASVGQATQTPGKPAAGAAAPAGSPAGRSAGAKIGPTAQAPAGQQPQAGQGSQAGGAGSQPSGKPSHPAHPAHQQPTVTGKLMTGQLDAVVAAGFEGGKPVGAAARFSAPAKQVVLYLKPKAMKLPAQVSVQWRLGRKVVAVQHVTLQSRKGSLVTIFSRSGRALPPGLYTVTVTAAREPIGELAFEITK